MRAWLFLTLWLGAGPAFGCINDFIVERAEQEFDAAYSRRVVVEQPADGVRVASWFGGGIGAALLVAAFWPRRRP